MELQLTFRADELTFSDFITLVPKLLVSLSQFETVRINVDTFDPSWDGFTQEMWKVLDGHISRHCPLLRTLQLEGLHWMPPHRGYTSQYGCIDSLIRAWMPAMEARGVIERICPDEDHGRCRLHPNSEPPFYRALTPTG